jgi:Spy/CpxP family protein refolding chaperone
MRSLNTIVVGLTSALASAAFAQAPRANGTEGIIVQAQAGEQMRSPVGGSMGGQTGQSGSGASVDRMKDQDKSNDPMVSDKDKDRGGYHARSSSRAVPARDRSSQARKGKEQPKDSGAD